MVAELASAACADISRATAAAPRGRKTAAAAADTRSVQLSPRLCAMEIPLATWSERAEPSMG